MTRRVVPHVRDDAGFEACGEMTNGTTVLTGTTQLPRAAGRGGPDRVKRVLAQEGNCRAFLDGTDRWVRNQPVFRQLLELARQR